MGKPTDTQQIRIYLNNNKGGVLDLSYASKHIFCDIPFDNLRQYISRFCKEGILVKISKGIYLIGDSDVAPEERIIKHYTADGRGMVGGKALLYQFGFLDEKSEKIKILTNLTKGNKKIDSFNIELIETKTCFHKYVGSLELAIAIELLANVHHVKDIHKLEFNTKLIELLRSYSDKKFERDIEILYHRNVYLLLDKYLLAMGISNRVMDIYEDKLRLHNC